MLSVRFVLLAGVPFCRSRMDWFVSGAEMFLVYVRLYVSFISEISIYTNPDSHARRGTAKRDIT
jgi:hypothetical protein